MGLLLIYIKSDVFARAFKIFTVGRRNHYSAKRCNIAFSSFGYMFEQPQVSIIMGSDSDLPTMQGAIAICQKFEIPHEVAIISAHRTPERMVEFAKNAHKRGLKVIIAGAGGAAHLPGMVAALSPLPVIGVPIATRQLSGVDSLYSIVQMPAGIPVATVAIGNADNAGLLAVQILASHNLDLLQKVMAYRQSLADIVLGKQEKLEQLGSQKYLQQM